MPSDSRGSESFILRVKPTNLQYFNELVTLMQETDSSTLR